MRTRERRVREAGTRLEPSRQHSTAGGTAPSTAQRTVHVALLGHARGRHVARRDVDHLLGCMELSGVEVDECSSESRQPPSELAAQLARLTGQSKGRRLLQERRRRRQELCSKAARGSRGRCACAAPRTPTFRIRAGRAGCNVRARRSRDGGRRAGVRMRCSAAGRQGRPPAISQASCPPTDLGGGVGGMVRALVHRLHVADLRAGRQAAGVRGWRVSRRVGSGVSARPCRPASRASRLPLPAATTLTLMIQPSPLSHILGACGGRGGAGESGSR